MPTSFFTETRVSECGLKPDSVATLERARQAGSVRIVEIQSLMKPEIRSDAKRLSSASLAIIDLLSEAGIRLEYNGASKAAQPRKPASPKPAKPVKPAYSGQIPNRGKPGKPRSAKPDLPTEPEAGPNGPGSRGSASFEERPALPSEPVEYDPTAPRDGLTLYLREISQHKLLTPGEEVDLAKRIKQGDAKARERMINANLRLVVKIARSYENFGMPFLDLINEGNIGLMKGVVKFDPNKGAKFSTYGAWWIKQAIRRALSNQSKTVRLPVHVVDKLSHIRRTTAKLLETLGREPEDEEIGQELKMSAAKVRAYRDVTSQTTSLDAPLGDDPDSSTIAEIVPDESARMPSQIAEHESDLVMLREILSKLDERENAILELRFGLKDGKERTLEEIGKVFGVTRERIRQIESAALKRLAMLIERLNRPRI